MRLYLVACLAAGVAAGSLRAGSRDEPGSNPSSGGLVAPVIVPKLVDAADAGMKVVNGDAPSASPSVAPSPEPPVAVGELTVPTKDGAAKFQTNVDGLKQIESNIRTQVTTLETMQKQIAETQRQTRLLKLTHSIMKGIVALRKSQAFLKRHDVGIAHYKHNIKRLGEEAGEIGTRMKSAEEDFRSERENLNKKLDKIRTRLEKNAAKLEKLQAHRVRVAELVAKWRSFVLALRSVHDKYTGVERPHTRAPAMKRKSKRFGDSTKLASPPDISGDLSKDLEGMLPPVKGGKKDDGKKRELPDSIYGSFGATRFAALHEGEAADVAETAAASAQLSLMQQELEQQRAVVAGDMEGGAAALDASEAAAAAEADEAKAGAGADAAGEAAADAEEQELLQGEQEHAAAAAEAAAVAEAF